MSRAAALLDRLADLPPPAVLAAGLSLVLVLSLAAMRSDDCTTDEGVHLAAGHAYVAKADYRLNPEHPPLGKLLAGIPLVALGTRWPDDPAGWTSTAQWELGFRLLYQGGNDPDVVLFAARLPTVLWLLVLVGALYAVALELYGPRGALLTLVLAVFCPTLLAHGHLVTTDVIVTVLFFLAVVAAWKRLTGGGWRWTAYTGVLAGGALAAKFSGVLVLPVLGWLVLVAWIRRRGFRARWVLEAAAAGLLAWIVLWGTYRFRFAPSPDGSYAFDWEGRAEKDPGRGLAMNLARRIRLLPEAYLYGFGAATRSYEGRASYAMGRHSETGFAWYFPFAILVKTPAAALALLGWAALAWVRRVRAGTARDDFLAAPAVIYGAVALASGLNIGLRHLLPVFPPLLVAAGGLPLEGPRRPGAALGLLGLTAGGVLLSAPGFIGYFNLPSRLLAPPHALLVDSNLDWGQDLGKLRAWMDRHGVDEVKLAYFGSASPRHAGVRHRVLPGFAFYARFEPEWKPAGPPRPGDVVAISATVLVGAAPNGRHPSLDAFARLRPDDAVGDSILIFRIR